MFNYSKSETLEHIKVFKAKGYFDKFQKMYKKFPITKCNACGVCCTDSPIVTYPEFLYVMDYFYNSNAFNDKIRIDAVKNAIREYMYGLVENDISCVFYDKNKGCKVYERAPIACKRWGNQSLKDNENDVKADHERNKLYKEFYRNKGINIPDEVINRVTPYCSNVKIVKDPYKFNDLDWENIYLKDLPKIIFHFADKEAEDYSLCSYMVYMLYGKKIYDDRIAVIRDYQSGNKNAVEDFIAELDLSCV